MIGALRRIFVKTIKDPWDMNQELQPGNGERTELQTDTAVLLAATHVANGISSSDLNMKDYYRSVVQSAISQGGMFRGQQMSIPWLRMTLAGLEMRSISPEVIWEGEQTNPNGTLPEMPLCEDLFPSESDLPQV
jgi:hypothetical protein